jgi:hypothetical protein
MLDYQSYTIIAEWRLPHNRYRDKPTLRHHPHRNLYHLSLRTTMPSELLLRPLHAHRPAHPYFLLAPQTPFSPLSGLQYYHLSPCVTRVHDVSQFPSTFLCYPRVHSTACQSPTISTPLPECQIRLVTFAPPPELGQSQQIAIQIPTQQI